MTVTFILSLPSTATNQFFQVAQKFLPDSINPARACVLAVLKLEEALFVGILRQEVCRVDWIGFFKIFEGDSRFVQGYYDPVW